MDFRLLPLRRFSCWAYHIRHPCAVNNTPFRIVSDACGSPDLRHELHVRRALCEVSSCMPRVVLSASFRVVCRAACCRPRTSYVAMPRRAAMAPRLMRRATPRRAGCRSLQETRRRCCGMSSSRGSTIGPRRGPSIRYSQRSTLQQSADVLQPSTAGCNTARLPATAHGSAQHSHERRILL